MFIRKALNVNNSHMSGYLRLETEIFSCVSSTQTFIFISVLVIQSIYTWLKNKTITPPKISAVFMCSSIHFSFTGVNCEMALPITSNPPA